MKKAGKILRKVILWLLGSVLGLVVWLLVTVVCVLYVPSLRKTAFNFGLNIAREQTGLDIEVGDIYLSPFHHSPLVFYHAYKGQEDLPLEVKIDSLFVGHRGQDTLLYTHSLRLKVKAMTSGRTSPFSDFGSIPIVVNQLLLDGTTCHTDNMIESIGIDAIISKLETRSPEILLAEGKFPLHDLQLYDADICIELRETPEDTTTQEDSEPTPMLFEVPNGEMHNVRFRLMPMGLDVQTGSLATDISADVGGNRYEARRIEIGRLTFQMEDLRLPADTIYGSACVDLASERITSDGIHVRSDEMDARADLSSVTMEMDTMLVNAQGEVLFKGNKAKLSAAYNINSETYDATVNIAQVDLSSFLQDSPPMVITGEIEAEGKGLDIESQTTRSHVKIHLTDAIYDNINVSGMQLSADLANQAVDGKLHLPVAMTDDGLRVTGQTEHLFRVTNFMEMEKIGVDYRTQMSQVEALLKDEGTTYNVQRMDLHFTTDSSTALNLATEGLTADLTSPMHVMELLDEISAFSNQLSASDIQLSTFNYLDTLREKIPAMETKITLQHGSPAQEMIEKMGLDIEMIDLQLNSNAEQTELAFDAAIPKIENPEDSTAMRLPAAKAAMRIKMTEGNTTASLTTNSLLSDGAMSLHGLKTDANIKLDLTRDKNILQGEGLLKMDSLIFGEMVLGSREIKLDLARSESFADAFKADVQLDDLPLEIVDSIIKIADLNLNGAIRAKSTVDGLPSQLDISAEVLPLEVSALYKPYDVQISLGETPIVMEHNKVDFNGLPIYGADSTFLTLTGGLDLDSMRLDVALAADSFAPVKLHKDGPFPVHGEFAADMHGTVSGPLDSIIADVDVTILPSTDITYPIDKKNLAQVKPHGTVNVRYALADSMPLNLGGQINVDDGFIRYSPKIYPVMPFHVDSGSTVTFNGPIEQTLLNVSASQKVKADVQSEGEETRRVDFTTGVRVNGAIDSIGMNTIGFFLEAPNDETITHELASVDEETREGLAATLLATGMYVGGSNAAAQNSGYALSSIINSRINAALANSKVGKVIDIDISNAQTEHAGGKTNDMNISISKSFLKDRLRITLGSTLTDNPEINQTSGLLSNLSAEYKLTKDGNVLLRAFADRDYNNVLEGELYKTGLGVRAFKDWCRKEMYRGDSISRTYNLTADAGVAYRSNNSIGPDLTLKSSIRNLMGHGETFTIKGNGAYYWALRNRHPGDPKKTDTYKFGVNTSLIFPYLHWAGNNNPEGDTRYMLGYQYENIAGGYGVHKLTGSLTYFIHSSKYITHAFTPFSLSIVMMKAESDSLLDKAATYPQLIKVIAGNEFVPSIGYTFTYNDYRSKRAVNTLFEVGVKESGNLINAIYCLAGHEWDEKDKKLGDLTFNQFVKLNAELRNKFNFTDQVCIATRLYAGANIPLGNSYAAPLSEAFYSGGPNSFRAASPYAYGPGNFYSDKYNQNFFHSGDVKLEANFELRFPIVWKLFGAAFLDAGNVWNWYNGDDLFKAAGISDYKDQLQLREELHDGIFDNPDWARQIALGTGAGLRLDLDGLVIRLDFGVAIHAPYQTYRYDKKTWQPDKTQPINTYFNIPSALDAIRVNFGIGYPF